MSLFQMFIILEGGNGFCFTDAVQLTASQIVQVFSNTLHEYGSLSHLMDSLTLSWLGLAGTEKDILECMIEK